MERRCLIGAAVALAAMLSGPAGLQAQVEAERCQDEPAKLARPATETQRGVIIERGVPRDRDADARPAERPRRGRAFDRDGSRVHRPDRFDRFRRGVRRGDPFDRFGRGGFDRFGPFDRFDRFGRIDRRDALNIRDPRFAPRLSDPTFRFGNGLSNRFDIRFGHRRSVRIDRPGFRDFHGALRHAPLRHRGVAPFDRGGTILRR